MLQSVGSQRVTHDSAHTHTHTHTISSSQMLYIPFRERHLVYFLIIPIISEYLYAKMDHTCLKNYHEEKLQPKLVKPR